MQLPRLAPAIRGQPRGSPVKKFTTFCVGFDPEPDDELESMLCGGSVPRNVCCCRTDRLLRSMTVTVAPITSTIRHVPSEVVLDEEDGMKAACAVNLHNAVTVSQERLGRRVAQLRSWRMAEICAALRFSLGCDL